MYSTLLVSDRRMNDSDVNCTKECLNGSTESASDFNLETAEYRDMIAYIRFVLLAIILWSGLICNILAFVCILTSKILRKTTTGHYLIALTCADSIYIIGMQGIYLCT